MEILIALIVVLTVVTLLGHGIWVLLAWMIRAGAPLPPRPKLARTHCPHCETKLLGVVCPVCHWPADSINPRPTPPAVAELRGQIERYHRLGLIDVDTYTRLHAALAGKLAEPPDTVAPAELPVVAATTVPLDVPAADNDDYELAPNQDLPVLAEIVTATADVPARDIVPITERARLYAERQAQSAREAERPPEPAARLQPKEPRRPWTDLLSAFMEEKNIRWGELVGGLLIVCCSVALVISFWAKIAERPFLKFFVFNGVTAALFGLGLYSEKRWKLRTTSDGLLITAMLLVPLNFLAIAAFSQGAESRTVLTIAGELVSISLFSVLLVISGRTVAPNAVWPLAVGVMLPAVLQLLIRRFVGPQPSLVAEGFGLGILGVFATVNAIPIWLAKPPANSGSSSVIDETTEVADADPHGYGAFKLLGITLFATALACGLIVFKTEDLGDAIHRFAPLACLAGLTPLAVGLRLWRRLTTKELMPQRTAALAIAVGGALLLGAGVVLAWPTPALLLPSAALAATVLVGVAILFQLPQGLLAAAPCVVLFYLVACNTLRGTLALHGNDAGEALAVLLSGSSGVLLAPLALTLGATAAVLRYLRRSDDSLFTGISALGVVALSVALVSWFGFARLGDPLGATWIYSLYAAFGFVAAIKVRNVWVLHVSAGFALLALMQGIVYWLPNHHAIELPWTTALVAGAGLAALVGLMLSRLGDTDQHRPLVAALHIDAEIISVVAGGLLCAAVVLADASMAAFAERWTAVATVWLLLAITARSAAWFSAFQTALAVAASFALADWLHAQDWFTAARYPWLDPWTITVEAVMLSAMALGWIAVRWWVRERPVAGKPGKTFAAEASVPSAVEGMSVDDKQAAPAMPKVAVHSTLGSLLNPPWPQVDALLLRLALLAGLALTVYAALPGVAQELSPRSLVSSPTDNSLSALRVVPPLSNFELPGIDHDHARTPGVWLLLGLLAVALIAETAVRKATWSMLGLLLVAALVCPVLASHWQDEVATASALRWLCSIFLLVASLPIWFRGQIAAAAARLGWPRAENWGHDESSISGAVAGVFVMSLLPIAAMATFVGGSAVWRTPPAADVRWLFTPLAIVFAVAAVIALVLRASVANRQSTAKQTNSSRLKTLAVHASSLLLMLGVAPLLAVTLYVVAAALKLSPILGPEPTSWFFRVGLAVSYAVPVLVTALTLVGYAVRESSQRFALAGSLVCNVGVTAAYLLSITKTGLKFDSTQWLRLAQLNAITSATFALAWIGGLWWWSRRSERAVHIGDLLVTLVSLPLALNLLALTPTWLAIVVDPDLTSELAPVADAWGWLAAIAAGAALTCVERLAAWPAAIGRQLGKAFVLVTLLACHVGAWVGNSWAALHALLGLHLAICGLVAFSGWIAARSTASPLAACVEWLGLAPRAATTTADSHDSLPYDVLWWRSIARWSVLTSVIAVGLALRLLPGDPQSSWWTVGALVAVASLAAFLACWALQRGLLYYAAVLINLAATTWWNEIIWSPAPGRRGTTWLLDCWHVNVIALALPAVVWLLIERRVFQAAQPALVASRVIPVHRLAARLSIAMTALAVGLGLAGDAMHSPSAAPLWGGWLSVASISIAAAACLWDARARDAIALLYVVLLLWSATLLDSLNLDAHRLLWLGTIALAGHGLATSYLWSRRDGLRQLADPLHIPHAAANNLAQHAWLLPANCLLAVFVVVMVFAIQLTFADFTERILAAKAVLIEAVAIGLLARGARRTQLQFAALGLGAIGIIALGWSAIEPGSNGALLNRAVVVTAALAATTVLYGLGLTKLLKSGSEWLGAAQRMTPVLVAAAACALVFVLGSEGMLAATHGQVAMSWPAIVVVALALLGLCGAALAAAVLPGRDPLGLSENGRKLYVYGAEVALALLFVHIRLTMPWLFHGFFQRYWPLIVMLIAFVGAGVGEWLRRRKLVVIGEPLENTGALLPLLGVLGFWVLPNNVDYSLLLLSVGLLYAGLSVARKSFGFGVLAALAANGGLWYFLNRADGYRLVDHPQLWLIPPALCVLIAAHINRRQLTPAQMSAVRYGTSVAVYVSSTADIFLNGVAEAPWLPLVLALLSLVGIFAGIWLRIRAFLFLGTAFLVLALLTVIWHAAVNLEQTWLWAASGIVAGVIIIAVFAVFEKKRDTVLGVVDELKRWE